MILFLRASEKEESKFSKSANPDQINQEARGQAKE